MNTSQYHVRLKEGRTYTLAQLEQAGLSYVLCYPDQPIFPYAALRSRKKQVTLNDYREQAHGKTAWMLAEWKSRQDRGVQIFTGKTSTRTRGEQTYYLTDFDIEKLCIDTYSQAYQQILSIYRNNAEHAAPVETHTKSGGMRLSAYTPARSKKKAFTTTDGDMLLEFFSEDGLSRYDHRYTLTSGCLLEIPFLSVSAAREIYAIAKQIGIEKKAKHTLADVVAVDTAGCPENITYNADGISPYYPIKFCVVTEHQKHPETQGKVQYFKDPRGGELGHCYDCGEWWWQQKPKHRTRKIKLHKSDHQLTLQTLQRSRAFLSEVFESTCKVFGLRADTGVGKNKAAEEYVVYKGIKLLLNLPHKNLKHELAARFDKAEIPPFAYRGILSNPDGTFPSENPCIQPLRYDAYARKGGNPLIVICSQCPSRWECENAGHWHDLRQLKKYQVNLFTFPQLFTNPIFRHWIQTNIGTLEKEDLILHDDTSVTALFNIIEVSRDYLENVSRQHHGTNTGSFAEILLSLLHTDPLYENLRTFIFDKITLAERELIIEGLSHVRIDGQLLTLDDAVQHGHFRIDTQQDINALPKVADREWTLLHQLELFFDMYPHAENAPITYTDGVLSFAIAPILPKTPARIGFMGATLQQEHLRRAFPEPYYPNVMYFDATSTEWHPDARVYQLATNRNPRRTVLTDGKLNATGQDYWDSVMEIVSRLDGKHAIITYKAVIDEKQADIEKHGIITAHFGGLTGLDTLFTDVDYLHILFSPERPPFAHQWDAKMIYGADAERLSFDRDDDGNFTDSRVQSVYDMGVIAELIQAIGRARLVNFGKKVFVWCSHYLPTITERDQTHLFTESNIGLWKSADTETFENIIAEQAERTPTDIAEEEGITERAAYKRTVDTRKQTKAEQKAKAAEMRDAGASITEIAKKLGINKSTVSRWLNP